MSDDVRAALFARVYADPADDAPRAVLADLLTEADDPRGEFIAKQLARAETALEKSHEREWLGAIAPAVRPGEARFERGFVDHVGLADVEEVEPTLAAPEWSTVTSLDLRRSDIRAMHLRDHAFRHVRHVTAIRSETLIALMAEPPLPWTTVGAKLERWSQLRNLRSTTFPDAKTIIVETTSQPTGVVPDLTTWLASFPAIETVMLPVEPARISELLAIERLGYVMLSGDGYSLYWHRDSSTLRYVVLFGDRRPIPGNWAAAVARQIEALRPSEVDLHFPSSVRSVDDATLSPLRAAATKVGAALSFRGIPV